MLRRSSSLWIVAFAVACGVFEPHSSKVEVEQPTGADSFSRSGPIVPAPPPQPDSFAASQARLFALNPQSDLLSIFAFGAAAPRFVQNVEVPAADRRVLVAAPQRDAVAVLRPKEGSARWVCTDTPESTTIADVEVVAGADALAFLAPATDPTTPIVAYGSGVHGFATDNQISLITLTPTCSASVQTVAVGEGPHRVLASTTPNVAYVMSADGVRKLEIGSAASDPFYPQQLHDAVLAAPDATHEFLVGRHDGEVVVVDSTGAFTSLGARANSGAPGPLRAPAQGGDGGASSGGADGIESAAGAESVTPDPLQQVSAFALPPDNTFVLASDGKRISRLNLPNVDELFEVTSPASAIAVGSGNDCAVAYSTGQRFITKLELSPLSAQEIELQRPVQSATLLCRPAEQSGAPPSCCTGIALVSYFSNVSPLGQTEGYSLVDLATGKADLRRSTMHIAGATVFDSGRALLLARSDSARKHYAFSVISPFSGDNAQQLDGELSDAASLVGTGYVDGSVGFVGLNRRDGGLLLVTRSSPTLPAPIYTVTRQSDFRLSGRVTPLKGLEP